MNLSYKTAKELERAGFRRKGFNESEISLLIGEEAKEKDVRNSILFTELSELIEACGNVEFRLHCYPKGFGLDVTGEPWYVIERPNWGDMPRCSTPEEAVAALWLALNEKSL